MDGATATGPLIALGVAVLGLLAVGAAALAARSSAGQGRPREFRDDLPAFGAHPPGSPGAPILPRSGPPVLLAVPPAPVSGVTGPSAGNRATARALLTLAAVVLLAVAAAAGVGLAGRTSAGPARQPHARPVPALPAVPASPSPGQSGAGRLAGTSLPLGPGDTAARMGFDGIVLERQAVGVTVTYPSVSVISHGTLGLAHVRLPTFNCLTADAPADPLAAGCVPSVTQYADLPTPALQISADGTRLSMRGRFPTYVRPNGTAPHYTGAVYGLTVTVTAGRRLAPGVFEAHGVLSLGDESARSSGAAPADVLRRGR